MHNRYLSILICIMGVYHIDLSCFEQEILKKKDDQWTKIAVLSQDITKSQDSGIFDILNLYNERGITYLFLEEYDKALEDFNYILEVLCSANEIKNRLFGTGLWGRFLCHAYENLEKEAFEDLDLIHSYFIHDCHSFASSQKIRENFNFSKINISSSRSEILPIANFENPDERISSSECKERVIGTANVMRLLIAKIKNPALVGAANYAISELERICCNCCSRQHWTECLNPIVDAWNYIKDCMNKGVAIAPRIIFPGR